MVLCMVGERYHATIRLCKTRMTIGVSLVACWENVLMISGAQEI